MCGGGVDLCTLLHSEGEVSKTGSEEKRHLQTDHGRSDKCELGSAERLNFIPKTLNGYSIV